MARARIGTAGWSYSAWRDDFYAGIPAARWLDHVAANFDTVEVNASYYRLPLPKTVAAWAQRTPDDFAFTFKMWRAVTHDNRLKDARPNLERFFAAVEPMPKAKRASVLLQLPPQMNADPKTLDAGLAEVREVGGPSWRLALEFRNPTWDSPDVYKVLDRHRAALCLHDMPSSAVWDPNKAPFVYVRRHGTTGRYTGRYSDAMLGADVARMRDWLREGRDVLVYFNNDNGGYAPYDALRLRRMLDGFPAPASRPRRPSRRSREVAEKAGAVTLGKPRARS